jgi:hypothetical protein
MLRPAIRRIIFRALRNCIPGIKFVMRHLKLSSLLLSAAVVTPLAILAPISAANDAQDELSRLRTENAALKAQLTALQASCSTPSAGGDDKRSAQTPAASVIAPEGYQLVKVEPVEPYSRTGCKKYKDAIDIRWKQPNNWEILSRGLPMRDVEELLGVEHYDVKFGSRIGWQYGKCEAAAKGEVVFDSGKVLFWRKPIF